MFAPRPVQDPFQTYNTRHRDMVVQEDLQQQSKQHQQHHSEQEMGQQAPPQSDHSSHMGRRKRSFHFEPEFVAALDASLNEPRQAPPRLARMNKRMRPDVDRLLSEDAPYTASAESIGTSATKPPLRERISSQKIPDGGVSIIDLSSGEELASLQLGENKHKRRRDSTTDSSSSGESLREVFDVMEDGSLQPVLDHVPVLPSPMKRMRTHKTLDTSMNRVSRSSFEVLEEHQDHVRSVNNAQYCSHQFAGMEDYRNSQPMSMVDQDEYSGSDHTTNTSRTELGALIRYEGPKTMTLVDGVDALIRQRWSAQPELSNAQGNELVLYRRPPPTFLSSSHDHDDDNGSDDSSQPWARIEELKDDDDVSCSSQGSAIIDPSLQELEDRIMDMDLD
ncbi:hypothetical protein EDD11_009249 [Mortierella claussenii]|nr:hypothetical protein EDD11_009249 [Mortierella claussenii]